MPPNPQADTPLRHHLIDLIRRQGPLSLADFMATALYHPNHGYYRRARAVGREGDFITAPEISQMFGELIGLWAARVWLDRGAPSPVCLAELGPGRGTLMADALRATRSIPGFHDALSLHLVEVNAVLKARQAAVLTPTMPVRWHDRLEDLPDGLPLLVVANEYFDCFPVRQFQLTDKGWCERLVALDQTETNLCLALSPDPVPATALERLSATPLPAREGAVVETAPGAKAAVSALAHRVVRQGAAALLIDYGETGYAGATLQAVRAHRKEDIFAHVGEADLTAHVDFAQLKAAAEAEGAAVYGPVSQGSFLRNLGIAHRAHSLSARATPEQRADIETALHRLTAPDQMGDLFKCLVITPAGLAPPPGIDHLEEQNPAHANLTV